MLTAEQLAEAKQLIDSAAANANGNGAGPTGWGLAPASGFMAPAPQQAQGPHAVLVPIKIPTPNGGSIRVYLQFPGEAAANAQTLMALLGQLAQTMPLDVWTPKPAWGGRGNYGGNNRGNYGGNGNGGWNGGSHGGW